VIRAARWPAVALGCAALIGCTSDTTSRGGAARYPDATAVAKKADCDYESGPAPAGPGPRPSSYGRCGAASETVAIRVFADALTADDAIAVTSSPAGCASLGGPDAAHVWLARGANWYASSADGANGVRALARATDARFVGEVC
jgi:hypothetical protein